MKIIERLKARKITPELFHCFEQPVWLWNIDERYFVGRNRFSVWKPMPNDIMAEEWDQQFACYQTNWSSIDPNTEKKWRWKNWLHVRRRMRQVRRLMSQIST